MLSKTFTNKLKAYSALAGSFLVTHGADAQIVYTNINPDTVLGGFIPPLFPLNESYNLDLNNDGVFDYRATFRIWGTDDYWMNCCSFLTWSFQINFYGLNTQGGGTFNKVLMTYPSSEASDDIPYMGGKVISLNNDWYYRGRTVEYLAGNAGGGIFFYNRTAYLGLELTKDNKNYFGWVRLTLHQFGDPPGVTLQDYAYNSVPDAPIFTGQRVTNACPDPYEPTWLGNYVPSISFGTPVSALISPEGDIDKYKITVVASAPNVRAVLSNLPKNYNLRLLNSASAIITSSHHPGLTNDTVIANGLTPGTYYVEVLSAKNRFHPEKCYSLIAESSATPFREAEEVTPENATNDFLAFPNPANDVLLVSGYSVNALTKLNIYDMTGKLVLAADNSLSEPDGSVKINITSLPEGTYVLHSQSEQVVGVTKFIVQR